MSTYKAPLRDIRFVLFDILQSEKLFAECKYDGINKEVVDAVLDEAARFTENVLAPLNAVGDKIGNQYDKETGSVKTAPGFKEAYDQYIANGWPALTAPEQYGGQELPQTLGVPIKEMLDASNLAWSNFSLLSHGAIEALLHHGDEWQRETFLRNLVNGQWTGTMCLTEPHAGSDLGILKTKAIPNDDGTYSLSGTKIFITAGEHDLTENIVHLVLARLPDAPAGSKGISLFIVPKFDVNDKGELGERNGVRCGAIEHKMGIHGSPTCVINFDNAKGWLVGQPNKGMMAMFTMMNSARLGVGIQGLSLADRAYQNALRYSRERLQMRSLAGPVNPDKPADPIIVHPDVRRMLLTQKALIEGGRMLSYHAGTLLDEVLRGENDQLQKNADDMLSFLIPIIKACLTEWGVECIYNAQQCFGGHGYIQEHGIEQLARDARITTMYEGTTGIQALDLVGRKVMQLQGIGFKGFMAMIQQFIITEGKNDAVSEFIQPLSQYADEWQKLTLSIAGAAQKNPNEIGAASYDYLFYSGYVSLAYWWARAVAVADRSNESQSFKDAIRVTARFFYTRILSRASMHAANIHAGADTLMALAEDAFD